MNAQPPRAAASKQSPRPAPDLRSSMRPLRRSLRRSLIAVAAAVLCIGTARADGDADHGKALYNACLACHAVDKNDIGPMHRGVFGRTAGTVPDYSYSPALKASGIAWTEGNLDKWLTSPQGFVPGSKMFFKVINAQDRADIIAYLRTLTN